jgi:hypothetical protein
VCRREEQLQITMNQEQNKANDTPCCYQPCTELKSPSINKSHKNGIQGLNPRLNKMEHKVRKRGLTKIILRIQSQAKIGQFSPQRCLIYHRQRRLIKFLPSFRNLTTI